MGKSIRSKTKRSFRAKKREDSVYAAVHSARLNRLHRKLKEITLTDKDGDLDVEDVSQFSDDGKEGGDERMQGSSSGPLYWQYAVLGLLDPESITMDVREAMNGGILAPEGYARRRGEPSDAEDFFPHLFTDPDH